VRFLTPNAGQSLLSTVGRWSLILPNWVAAKRAMTATAHRIRVPPARSIVEAHSSTLPRQSRRMLPTSIFVGDRGNTRDQREDYEVGVVQESASPCANTDPHPFIPPHTDDGRRLLWAPFLNNACVSLEPRVDVKRIMLRPLDRHPLRSVTSSTPPAAEATLSRRPYRPPNGICARRDVGPLMVADAGLPAPWRRRGPRLTGPVLNTAADSAVFVSFRHPRTARRSTSADAHDRSSPSPSRRIPPGRFALPGDVVEHVASTMRAVCACRRRERERPSPFSQRRRSCVHTSRAWYICPREPITNCPALVAAGSFATPLHAHLVGDEGIGDAVVDNKALGVDCRSGPGS